jgi:hypothetical protein
MSVDMILSFEVGDKIWLQRPDVIIERFVKNTKLCGLRLYEVILYSPIRLYNNTKFTFLNQQMSKKVKSAVVMVSYAV